MDTKKTKELMLKALKKTKGIVSVAAESVNIARTTHYLWMDTDPEYKEAVKAIDESAIDFAESKLFELIDGARKEVVTQDGIQVVKDTPNPTATIFYLKTKAKHRGYVERQEITGADGGPVQIIAPDNI
jgi:hypothetical protein